MTYTAPPKCQGGFERGDFSIKRCETGFLRFFQSEMEIASFNFLLSSCFLNKCQSAESFGTNTVYSIYQRNKSPLNNNINHRRSSYAKRSNLYILFFFSLFLHFFIKSRTADSFKTFRFTVFSADLFLTTSKKLYESRSQCPNFQVLSVFQLSHPQIFSNESQSAKSVGSFDFFLKIPVTMLFVRIFKHCIQCCMFKFS